MFSPKGFGGTIFVDPYRLERRGRFDLSESSLDGEAARLELSRDARGMMGSRDMLPTALGSGPCSLLSILRAEPCSEGSSCQTR